MLSKQITICYNFMTIVYHKETVFNKKFVYFSIKRILEQFFLKETTVLVLVL